MITLSETESKQRLGDLVVRPAEQVTCDLAVALAFVDALSPVTRVVAKASGVAHKTEGNLVRLGLDRHGLASCFDELAAAGDGSVVVAEMIPTDVEMIVGGVRDAIFGPVITIGAGGVAAEASPDVVALLSPPEAGEVAAAITHLRMAPILGGWRNRAPIDLAAFERLVGAVAAQFDDATVMEVDVNPVAIVDGVPIVLDALVVVGGSRSRR